MKKKILTTEQAKLVAETIKNKTAVPCYGLIIDRGRKPLLTDSKLGGLSCWPPTKEYPAASKGNKMVLLAQINFAKVHVQHPLPQEGILQFFLSYRDDFMYGLDEETDCQENFRVVYHEHIDNSLTHEQVESLHLPICGKLPDNDAMPLSTEYALNLAKCFIHGIAAK